MKTNILPLFFWTLFFCTSSTAKSQLPGNVPANLQLWLRADAGTLHGALPATDGQALNTWMDQSAARTNNATDANTPAPAFRNNAADNINYNPVVDFNGTNNGLDFGSDYIYSSGTGAENGMVWFAVVQPDVNSHGSQFVFDFGALGGEGYGLMYGYPVVSFYSPLSHGGSTPQTGSTSHSRGTQTTLARMTLEFENSQRLFLDGASSPVCAASITLSKLTGAEINESSNHGTTRGPFTLGRQSKSSNLSGRLLDGSIAELVGYSRYLSEAEIIKIESYLAIKYGITLDNVDGGTSGDYQATDGTVIWDASAFSSYHHNVIGIGRDDNTALHQKQSRQINDSARIYLSSLSPTNDANSGTFSSDNQFVLIGNNDSAAVSTGSTEYPSASGIFSRLDREWKITNTNFNGTFSLDLKLIPSAILASDLRILLDDDGDFSDATMYNPSISYSEGVVTISDISTAEVPINSTRFLTVVSLSSHTTLPGNLLSFNATGIDHRSVELTWHISSGAGDKAFVAERSGNARYWEAINTMKARGNSSITSTYHIIDKDPIPGISYYRLKLIDHDGSFTYSRIKTVNLSGSSGNLHIYPNPTIGPLVIEGSERELSSIQLFNEGGENMTGNVQLQQISPFKIILDLSNLPSGAYYIRSATKTGTVYKR